MCFTLIQNEKSMQLLKKMVTNQARKKPTLQKKYLHTIRFTPKVHVFFSK
jgi:hypothetical protein